MTLKLDMLRENALDNFKAYNQASIVSRLQLGPIDPWCAASVLYLASPLLFFLATWVRPEFGVVAVAGAVLGLIVIVRSAQRDDITSPAAVCVAAVTALLFSLLSGTLGINGGVGYLDAAKHVWVAEQLAAHRWPVALCYEGAAKVLRYSIGLYLVPSSLGQVSKDLLHDASWIWQAAGILLVLMLMPTRDRVWRMAVAALVFTTYSSVDVFASRYLHPEIMIDIGLHAAWARDYGWLYGSNLFAMGWTPQHAIPSWILAGLVFRGARRGWLPGASGLLLAAALLWSPFAAISLALLLMCTDGTRPGSFLTIVNIAAVPAIVVVAMYLRADSAGVHATTMLGYFGAPRFWTFYIALAVFGFGLLAVCCLVGRCDRRLVLSACAVLLLLPMIVIGVSSDLQMRGSTLPVGVLVICGIAMLTRSGHVLAQAGAAIVFASGAISSVAELRREAVASLEFQPEQAFGVLMRDYAPQYLAASESEGVLRARHLQCAAP